MTVFDKAIADIFKCQDFLEQCVIQGEVFKCVCSSLSDTVMYVDTGSECPASFSLDIQLPVHRVPKINDKVVFRGEKYKISSVDTDSANASIKLHLVEMSKGIG